MSPEDKAKFERQVKLLEDEVDVGNVGRLTELRPKPRTSLTVNPCTRLSTEASISSSSCRT